MLMQMMTGGFLTNPKEHYVCMEPSWNQDEGCIFFRQIRRERRLSPATTIAAAAAMPPPPHDDDDPCKLTSSGFEGIAPMRPRRGKESILAKTWPFFKEPIYIVALCKASECKVVMLLALHMLYSIFFSGRPARARTAARRALENVLLIQWRHQWMALPMISRAKKPHPADAGSGFCLSGGGAAAKAAGTSNAAARSTAAARRRRLLLW